MYFALIVAGKVQKVIVAEKQFIEERGAELAGDGAWVELTDAHNLGGQRPSPGWTFDGAKFTRPAGGV